MSGIVVWLAVFAIGGTGSVARYVVDGMVTSRLGRGFPVGTLAINLSGAFVLGLLAGLALTKDQSLLAGTAAVGSYTTFSTWVFDSQRLAEAGRYRFAVVNIAASMALGLGAAALGNALTA